MDMLCATVKSELLAEFAAARRRLQEQSEARLQAQAEAHAQALAALRSETEAGRGLTATLETNLAKKDAIIDNLTEALGRERDKSAQARRFYAWKVQLSDRKREHFANVLAERHSRLQAARKAFRGWRLVIENKWRERAERACQTRAQEVCHRLSQDYEGRVRDVRGGQGREGKEGIDLPLGGLALSFECWLCVGVWGSDCVCVIVC